MNFTIRFVLFQAVIIVPFALGYFTKGRHAQPEAFTKRLIRLNLMGIEPLLVLWSIWGLNLTAELFLLPLSGVLMVLFGMLMGVCLASLVRLEDRSRATFIISSSLANHGFTMGGFLCYLFLGEQGLGLSFIFIAYFMPYTFLVIFPYARLVQTRSRYNLAFIKDFLVSMQNMPLYAILLAIGLKLCGLERPEIFFPTDALLMISIALYYFTLGINFTIGDLSAFNRDNMLLCAVRFLMVPALTVIVLSLVHLDPAVEAVMLIESFMPAAVYSVMSAVLFGLDIKRAASMFVFNTVVFLAGVLPCLIIFRHALLHIIG